VNNEQIKAILQETADRLSGKMPVDRFGTYERVNKRDIELDKRSR